MSVLKRRIKVKYPRSLFITKTFIIGLLSFLSGCVPILLDSFYTSSPLTLQQINSLIALLITFGFLIVGRTTNDPVFTPPGLPGANKIDYE